MLVMTQQSSREKRPLGNLSPGNKGLWGPECTQELAAERKITWLGIQFSGFTLED
jgi:hypothetical protein